MVWHILFANYEFCVDTAILSILFAGILLIHMRPSQRGSTVLSRIFHLPGKPDLLHLIGCRPLSVTDYSGTPRSLHPKQI